MNKPAERPLFFELLAELRGLTDELREMMASRWELARLELTSDLRSARRLVIFLAASVVMLLTSLPLLVVALAETLDGCCELARRDWLLILAGVLALLSAVMAGLAWRRFRRRFLGLEETLEELREDLVWLKEQQSRGDSAPPDKPGK